MYHLIFLLVCNLTIVFGKDLNIIKQHQNNKYDKNKTQKIYNTGKYFTLDTQNEHTQSITDRDENAFATVFNYDSSLPNDSATVYFMSTEWDTVVSVLTNSLGIASTEIEPGLWSTYAHNNTDNGTYIDLWDGGVFEVAEDGMVDNVEMYLYPRNEYGFLIVKVRSAYEDQILDYIPMTPVMIEDTTGNTIYYGITNVWGDTGTPLLPEQEYNIMILVDGDYQEQSIYIDTTDTYYEIMFLFEDNEGGGNEDSSNFNYEIAGFNYMGMFESHYYFVSHDTLSWQEAYFFTDTVIIEEGMNLYMATISSEQENNFIQNSFDTTIWNLNSVWIGLTDEIEEDNWQWVNGEELIYTNWNIGEPNNAGGNEHYVELNRYNGYWNDLPNYYSRAFVIELEIGDGAANILAVEDVPNDQGGRVYITFERSLYDTDELGRTEMYTVERLNSDTWVGLNSIGAYGSNVYTIEASTLLDSSGGTDGLITYRIIANMDEGNFESNHATGYSIDNIAPDMVTGLNASMINQTVSLSWNISYANDISHYNIYYSIHHDFVPSEENLLTVEESVYYEHNIETFGEQYYIVSAVDINDNESQYSEMINVTFLELLNNVSLPVQYSLHQNFPNPFNPSTQIKYDLPEDEFVNITIYDIMCRRIRSLLNSKQSAGYHSISWDATNDIGEGVSAGMYIYMIHAGDFRSTKKMVLLK